jgi:hypothetical protein
MAHLKHGRRWPALGLWGDTARELVVRSGAVPPPLPLSGFTLSQVMASAVWELHEERQTAPPNPPEAPRLRSLKGRSPAPEEHLIALGIERLRSRPTATWARWVRLHHYDYRGAAVARAFLAEAREALPADPAHSAAWARLVRQAVGLDRVHYCSGDAEQLGLHLRAGLYSANADRCLGDWERAEAGLRQCQEEAVWLGLTDPEFWSELASFLASLHRDCRDFRKALEQAELAAAIRSRGGDRLGEARAMWQVASIYEQIGEPTQALAAIRRATPTVETLPDQRLAFSLRHAEVFYLARCSAFLEAYVAYRTLESDYALQPGYEPFRLWALALISQGREQSPEAEDAFRSARSHFLKDRNAYDAALVTVDLSIFLLDRNRPEEVLPLAVSMGQAFEALGVARETLASWAIFQTAAERRELTRAVAESMVRTLGEERAGAKLASTGQGTGTRTR